MSDRRIMYVCTDCAENVPECCGYYDTSDLVVMPDGRWLCENCFDEARWDLAVDDESFPPLWSDMPHPPEYAPTGRAALNKEGQSDE